MKIRYLSLLLFFVFAVSFLTFPVEAVTSGQIGDLYWNYDKATCTLTITGNGDMPDHYYDHGYEITPPWRYYSSSCYPLDHVVVEEGVTSIGFDAFGSLHLKTIQLPSTVKIIKYHAFLYTKIDMEQVELPSGLTEIDMEAFYRSKVKSLKLSPATKTIGEKAFGSSSLQSVNLGSVETIGNYAFENCQHLQGTLDLTSVKSLGEFAFKFCDELSGVRFGNDLTTIPDSAFAYCNITSLEVPGNVTTIGKEAFADCPIHSLKLNEGLVSIGESAFYLSLTEELELPSTLRSIGRAGLIDTNYNRIILNEGLISVGYNGIRTEGVLTVPSTVKSLAPRENESLIVLGKPFASRYDYSFMNWNGNNTIYTWYPREQWGNPAAWGVNEFQYVEFRILEPEIIELHEGQTLKLPDDPEQYELLDGWRVALDNGVLTAQKPCADVLIQIVDGQNVYHLIRVYPIPESCKNGLHTWSLTSTTPPDCITTGQTTYTCTACGATREETVPALGHAWTLTEILNEAEEGGHASMGLYTCSRCSETKEARLCAAEVFTDMPKEGNWAHDPIDWAYFNGITAGKTDTTFAPKDTVTRAEAVSFLWRTLGKPEPTTEENPFTDVPEGKYYTLPVLWAYENGITSGTTETTFGPKDKCTRSQIMVFIWAAAGKPEPTLEENPFTDVPEGKSYTKAVLWAYENGITSGIDEGLYGPKNSCTRAQIVAFLYKALPFLTAHEEPEPEFLEWRWLSGEEMDRNDLGIGGADYLWVTVRGTQVPELSTDDPAVVELSYEGIVEPPEGTPEDEYTYAWKVEVIGNGTAHIDCALDGEAVQTLTIDCEAIAFRDAWWVTDEGEDVPEEITLEDGAQAHLFVVMHYSEPIPGEDGMDPTVWELPTIYTDAPERLSLTLAALMPPSYVAAYDRGFLWNGTVSGSGPVHVFIELNGELVKTLTVNVP